MDLITVEIAPGVLVRVTREDAEERGWEEYCPPAPGLRRRGRETAALTGGPERAMPAPARKRRGR